MKKATLFLSFPRFLELRKSGDALTLEILDLMTRHGIFEAGNRMREIDAYIWIPEDTKKKVGAKPKWADGNVLYAWLAVERELQLARRKNPRVTPLECMKTKFRSLRNKPLRVLYDARPNPQHLDIKDPKTACRLHSDGKKLLKENEHLAKRWLDILAMAMPAA